MKQKANSIINVVWAQATSLIMNIKILYYLETFIDGSYIDGDQFEDANETNIISFMLKSQDTASDPNKVSRNKNLNLTQKR